MPEIRHFTSFVKKITFARRCLQEGVGNRAAFNEAATQMLAIEEGEEAATSDFSRSGLGDNLAVAHCQITRQALELGRYTKAMAYLPRAGEASGCLCPESSPAALALRLSRRRRFRRCREFLHRWNGLAGQGRPPSPPPGESQWPAQGRRVREIQRLFPKIFSDFHELAPRGCF